MDVDDKQRHKASALRSEGDNMRWRDADDESGTCSRSSYTSLVRPRDLLAGGIALGGALSIALDALGAPAAQAQPNAAPNRSPARLDARAEAKKIAFDRIGRGEKVLMLSRFPQTRRSWNRVIPLLSQNIECIPADLPSFGDSGILAAAATTEKAGRVFHEFVAGLGTPLHVVAHDFGAWVAYS